MNTLHIHRMHARYRLPHAALGARRRLDGILSRELGEAIDAVLTREPLSEREEVCVRRLRVPVRLRLASSDVEIAARWGEAVVAAIRAARRGTVPGASTAPTPTPTPASAEVVAYGSREQALLDVVVRVLRGDLGRAWAWRQLGLWRYPDPVAEDDRTRELVRTLVREPGLVVPILRELAVQGVLADLARRLEARHWISLAAAALEHSGVALDARPLMATESRALPTAGVRGSAGEAGAQEEVPRAGAGASPVHGVARRVLRDSHIGAACSLAVTGSRGGRALAALMVLDADPSWTVRPPALWLDLLDEIRRMREGGPASGPASPRARPEARTGEDSSETSPGTTGDAVVPVGASRENEQPTAGQVDGECAVAEIPSDSRRLGRTPYGGLLFLLNVLPAVGFPERAGDAFPGNSLRWVLYQTAVRLVTRVVWQAARRGVVRSVAEDDPALLAFAGLPPGSPVPSEEPGSHAPDGPGPVDQVVDDLVHELEVRDPRGGGDAVGILEWVCCREAEIVADPGWIEVRFGLSEVSTGIRRLGLDLDPGYVRWLGVVVRFIYE